MMESYCAGLLCAVDSCGAAISAQTSWQHTCCLKYNGCACMSISYAKLNAGQQLFRVDVSIYIDFSKSFRPIASFTLRNTSASRGAPSPSNRIPSAKHTCTTLLQDEAIVQLHMTSRATHTTAAHTIAPSRPPARQHGSTLVSSSFGEASASGLSIFRTVFLNGGYRRRYTTDDLHH